MAADSTHLKNNLRKRYGKWELVLDLGPQPAQRCVSCGARHWVDPERLPACPKCGGQLEETRERRQLFRSGFATKTEAQTALNTLRAERDAGAVVRPSRLTVDEWLTLWLAGLNDLRDTTRASYERLARLHVSPHIGEDRLQDVDTARLNTMYTTLAGEGLSPATIQRVHAVVSGAFGAAADDGKIGKNPARRHGRGRGPRLPKAQTAEAVAPSAWTAAQLRAFLSEMAVYEHRRAGGETVYSKDRLYALWRLLASTGMRRGEALALTWADVDLAGKHAVVKASRVPAPDRYGTVDHLPKGVRDAGSARRIRTLDLDDETVATLREHHKRQAAERLKAGAGWHAGPGGGWVFAYRDGRPMHPERVTRAFAVRVAKMPDLPTITPHGLRHTWATLALQAGVPVHVVSAQLGHASPDITLRVYAHVLEGQTRGAVETVAAMIDGG